MKSLNAADPVPKIGHTACDQFQSISPRKVRTTEPEGTELKKCLTRYQLILYPYEKTIG